MATNPTPHLQHGVYTYPRQHVRRPLPLLVQVLLDGAALIAFCVLAYTLLWLVAP